MSTKSERHNAAGRELIVAIYHALESATPQKVAVFTIYMLKIVNALRTDGVSLEEIIKVIEESDAADRLGVM